MKLYLVTSDTYDGYGCEYYVVGAFSSKEKAEAKINEIKEMFIGKPCDLDIVEIEVDKDYDILIDADIGNLFTTEIFIGGYKE